MTSYEEPIILNNNKLLEQIKILQSEIKPVENPIIAKFLPFLPYDVNKIILDKLDIQKKIYLHDKKFKVYVNMIVNSHTLLLYTMKGNGYTDLSSMIKSRDWDVGVFDYKNIAGYRYLRNLICNDLRTAYNNTNNLDMIKSIEKIHNKFDDIYEIIDKIYDDLQPLADITTQRHIHNITINGCLCQQEYKIFKSNSSINPHQFNLFIEAVDAVVNMHIKNILQVLNN